MTQTVTPIEAKATTILPAPVKRVAGILRLALNTNVVSEEDIDGFWEWFDHLLRNGSTRTEKDLNATEFLAALMPGKVIDIANRAKANAADSTKSDPTPGRHLLDYLKIDKPIVFLDMETAGLEGSERRVVELSLIKFSTDRTAETFTLRVNPEVDINSEASLVHGIKNEDVTDCPKFKDVAQKLYDFIDDCHLGGFNVLNFDLNILQDEFNRAGIDFNFRGKAVLDPMRIYHKNVPSREGVKRNLTAAYRQYCGKELKNAHNALADIFATVEVLKGQFETYDFLSKDVYQLSDYCRSRQADAVDPDSKFIWRKNHSGKWEVVFNFGKYKDVALSHVIATTGYVNWMLDPQQKFSPEVKELLQNAVKGIYPPPPQEKVELAKAA